MVMSIWNNVLTPVLHISTINFGEALSIFLLSKILFGGFRGGWRDGRSLNREMREKWSSMTREEKEKFKQEWRSRCSRWNRPSEATSTNA
jgi:hypothetical protein